MGIEMVVQHFNEQKLRTAIENRNIVTTIVESIKAYADKNFAKTDNFRPDMDKINTIYDQTYDLLQVTFKINQPVVAPSAGKIAAVVSYLIMLHCPIIIQNNYDKDIYKLNIEQYSARIAISVMQILTFDEENKKTTENQFVPKVSGDSLFQFRRVTYHDFIERLVVIPNFRKKVLKGKEFQTFYGSVICHAIYLIICVHLDGRFYSARMKTLPEKPW